MYGNSFNSIMTLTLLLWIILLKRIESSSCSCKSACEMVSKFDSSLTNVISVVEERTSYIKSIENIERKLQELENNEQVIRRGKSLPSPDPVVKKISEEVNNLRRKTEILEKVLHYVVSFLGSMDEKDVETLKNEVKKDDVVDKGFKALFSKVKVVAKRMEVQNLNDRITVLEDKVSKCEEHQLESASNFTKARTKINETLTRRSRQWEKRLQAVESQCKRKLEDLKTVPKQIDVLFNENRKQERSERALRRNLKYVEDKLQTMETAVLLHMKNDSRIILENFKEEWNANCSKGIAPCYFIEVKEPVNYGNNSWNFIDERESFEKSEDFWGCKPLRLSDYPQVSTTRDEERKTIWFRCKDGHQFLGIDFMKCIQKGIWVGRDEPPECPRQ